MRNQALSFSLFLAVCGGMGMLSAANAQTPAPQTYTLQYKFKPGTALHYNMSMNLDGTVTMGGNSIPMSTQMNTAVTETVESVRASDGAATVLMTTDSITSTFNGKPVNLPQDQVDKLQAGYIMVMSPAGKVISVSMPDGSSSNGMAPSVEQMSQSAVLPDHPVKIGDIWRGSNQMNLPLMQMQVYSKMTLAQVTTAADGSAMAEIDSKYGTDPDGASGAVAPGVVNTVHMSGTGIVDFNTTTGVMKHTSATLDVKLAPSPNANTAAAAPSPDSDFTVKLIMDLTSTTIVPIHAGGTAAPTAAL